MRSVGKDSGDMYFVSGSQLEEIVHSLIPSALALAAIGFFTVSIHLAVLLPGWMKSEKPLIGLMLVAGVVCWVTGVWSVRACVKLLRMRGSVR